MEKLNRSRYELKYFVNHAEINALRSKLTHMLKPDANMKGRQDYTVSSLYFDDYADSAFYEKLDGFQTRKKFRIRVYNNEKNLIRLEKKSKNGISTFKRSCIISVDEYEAIMRGIAASLARVSDATLNEFYGEMVFNYLRPKVIVEYDREAYTAETSELRVTFDKNLRVVYNSFDLFNANNVKGYIFDGISILEVKYNSVLPDYIRGVLSMVDQHSAAISKYVLCRDKYNEMREL